MAITIGSMRKPRRGQAMVEFALVSIVAVIVLFGSVQLALIGQLYLALGQMNYRGVRYAAVSPDCINATSGCGLNNQSIKAYMLSVASPTILTITNANANALTVNYANLTNPTKAPFCQASACIFQTHSARLRERIPSEWKALRAYSVDTVN